MASESPELSIRPVAESELEACAALIRAGFGTVAEKRGLTPATCPTHGAFLQADRLVRDRMRGHRQFGAFLAGHPDPVGYVTLRPRGDGGGDGFELEKLAVLPTQRHRGIGAALLTFADAAVRSWGGRRITIGIIEDETVLKDWYLAHGYRPTGTATFPNLPFTVGYMERVLDGSVASRPPDVAGGPAGAGYPSRRRGKCAP